MGNAVPPCRGQRLSIALGLAVFLGGMFLLLRPVVDPDLWFHLVVGRETWLRGALPPSEFYVFPLAGEPGAFHEWGFGLVYYAVENCFGAVGMTVFNAALSAAIATALYTAAVARLGHPHRQCALAAVVAALLLMEFRLVYRPETFLYLAIALELAVLEIFLARRDGRVLAALPVITLALTQCHPSALFLLAILAAYGLQAAVTGGYRPAGALALAGLASALAATVNPYGLEQLLLPLKFQSSDQLLDTLVEFLPAWKTPYRTHAVVGTALALGAGAYALRQRRLADLVLLIVFAALAWRYARNIALFAAVLALPLASLLAKASASRAGWRAEAPLLLTPGLVLIAAVWPAGLSPWGVGVDRSTIPEQAAARIAARHPNARVANFFHLGSYLAWASPSTRVLVDGRNYSYNRAIELHDRILRADPDWESLLEAWGIDVIVTPATLPFSGQLIPLVTALESHPAWRLVVREPAALMFVRTPLAQDTALPPSAVWQQAMSEAALTLEENPQAEGARATLALAGRKLGR